MDPFLHSQQLHSPPETHQTDCWSHTNHHHHLLTTELSKTEFTLPLPNFLIDPQDGQFTPYLDRSQASSPGHEYDDPLESNHHSQSSSPVLDVSPLRSRATSIALKKLIEIQAQRLLDVSAAWKKKYPGEDPETYSPEDGPKDLFPSPHDPRPDPLPKTESGCARAPNPKLASLHRPHRSLSQKSLADPSSLFDRLSLNDYKTTSKNTTPLDVEGWKREVQESKLKHLATLAWIAGLPLAHQFDPFDNHRPPSHLSN